jgi:6-phosphogluconolactonase
MLPLLIALFFHPIEEAGAQHMVYVGTYTGKGSEGIYGYRFDPATGELDSIGLAAKTDNPSFLAVDPKGQFLYAVNELDTFQNEPAGAVSVFAIERDSGKLRLVQQISSLGKGPAHLSLDRTSRYLFVANYGGGNVTVFPIGPDGLLGPNTAFMQAAGSSVNPDRQKGPHAHAIQVTNDNRYAAVADLGIDKVLMYRFDARTGVLTADSLRSCSLEPGSGPRHIVFDPSGKFMFVVNELTSTVTVFTFEPGQETFHSPQTISTLPKNLTGKNTTAEILIDAKGKFLYVSNRGDDSIVQFRIDPDNGGLTPVAWFRCEGKSPRHIAIDPTGQWLFAANQRSNEIRLFRINPESGRLTPATRSTKVISPVCSVIFSSQ